MNSLVFKDAATFVLKCHLGQHVLIHIFILSMI